MKYLLCSSASSLFGICRRFIPTLKVLRPTQLELPPAQASANAAGVRKLYFGPTLPITPASFCVHLFFPVSAQADADLPHDSRDGQSASRR
jgi:hypothetical protein